MELHSNLVERFSQESEELSELTLPSSINQNNINKDIFKTNETTFNLIKNNTSSADNYYDCSQLLFSHQDKDSFGSNLYVTPRENDTEVIGNTPLSMSKERSAIQG